MTSTVTVFIPCLIDQLYPEMGVALVNILKHLGYEVRYADEAVCCGQPAFNAGHHKEALSVASKFVSSLKNEETLVCPSGSCTAMVRRFYPELFLGQCQETEARKLGTGLFEFSEFLAREGKLDKISGSAKGKVGFHNSCHATRELKLRAQPIDIMKRITGYELIEVEPVCCGFGGLFSIKFDEIAQGIAKTRLEMFTDKGAECIVSNDPGCIMHLKNEAKVLGNPLEILHLTEFVAKSMGLSTTL